MEDDWLYMEFLGMKEFTHLAKIYGFYCWYNIHTCEVEGTTWLRELMISMCIWIDCKFEMNDGFYIELIEEL